MRYVKETFGYLKHPPIARRVDAASRAGKYLVYSWSLLILARLDLIHRYPGFLEDCMVVAVSLGAVLSSVLALVSVLRRGDLELALIQPLLGISGAQVFLAALGYKPEILVLPLFAVCLDLAGRLNLLLKLRSVSSVRLS